MMEFKMTDCYIHRKFYEPHGNLELNIYKRYINTNEKGIQT